MPPKVIDTKEMRERLGTIGPEIERLGALDAPSDEERSQFDSLIEESQGLRDRLSRANAANQVIDTLGQPDPETRAIGREDRSVRVVAEPVQTVRTPAIPRLTRAKHFKDEGGISGEERAYASGMWLLSQVYPSSGGAFRDLTERARQWWGDYGARYGGGTEERAMSTTANSLGGYLVPEVFNSTIIDLREDYGVFRRYAQVVPMSSDTASYPRRVSGLTAYFVNDNTEITASDKGWDQVNLTAKKLGILSKWSSELDEDAVISMADNLAREIAYQFALKEDQCGFIGTGTSTYGGIVGATVKVDDGNHAASIYTAATGNTAFSTLDLADFNGVVGKLPQYAAMDDAAWYFSRAGWANSMQRLADAGGGNTTSDITGAVGMSFMGYPVRISQVLNSTLTAQTDTIVGLFGSLRLAAMMGTRRAVRTMVSTERYFELDQIAIKGTERFDINVHSLGDGTNAGPLVALKTPGS